MSGKSEGKAKTGTASNEYKEAMLQAIRTKFHTISNVMQEGVDADGGYLVPDEYDDRLIEKLKEENIFRKLCHPVTTSGDHKINIAASTPAAAWIEEGEALTFGDTTFSQILLDAHKLHVAIKVTEELLYDSKFDLETFILNAFSKALANAEENAFINGSGTGQPLGILAATGGADIGVTTASSNAMDQSEFSRKYKGYEDRYTAIRDKVEKLREQSEQRKSQADSISAFMFEMHETDEPVMEFDSKLWTSVIDSVVVKHNGILLFRFRNGMEIEG